MRRGVWVVRGNVLLSMCLFVAALAAAGGRSYAVPAGNAGRTTFEVRFPVECPASDQDPKWKVVALVDDGGNLMLLGDTPVLNADPGNLKASGVVIANGVPFTLEQSHGSDPYATYQ